nr:ATP synthase F0 subunit 8 [Stomopneustes variolaris]
MPQLDFTWWIINFFIVWVALFIVLSIVLSSSSSYTSQEQASNFTKLEKNTTSWQWF